jgi:hypothetical protein
MPRGSPYLFFRQVAGWRRPNFLQSLCARRQCQRPQTAPSFIERLSRHPLSESFAINDNEKRLLIVAQLLSFVLVAIAYFLQALLSGTTPRQFGLQIEQIRESE